MEADEIPTAHIYAQHCYHWESRIVADRAALAQIRDACQRALDEGQSKAELFTADGEGYDLNIELLDEPFGSKPWNDLQLPYVGIEYSDCVGAELHEHWRKEWEREKEREAKDLERLQLLERHALDAEHAAYVAGHLAEEGGI